MNPEPDPDDREPTLVRRSPFALSVKLCPRCLSPLTSMNKDLMGFVPQEYFCPKCGYSGSVFLEKEREPDKSGE